MPVLDPDYAAKLTWRTVLKQVLFVVALGGLWCFAVFVAALHRASPLALLVFYAVWGLLMLLALASLGYSAVCLIRRR